MRDFFYQHTPRPTAMLDEALTGRSHSLFVELLIFFLVFYIASIPQSIILSVIAVANMISDPAFRDAIANGGSYDVSYEKLLEFLTNPPEWVTCINLFSTVFIILAAVIYCTKIERRPITSMGFRKTKSWIFEYLVGAGVGVGLLAATAGLVVLFGGGSLSFTPSSFSPIFTVLFLVGYIIQGAAEETALRGYFMITLSKRQNMAVAVFASSLLFGLLHLANNGVSLLAVVNITLFGVFLAVYMLKRGSIYGVLAIHSFWNFTQDKIFGFSVSGQGISSSLFSFTPKFGKAVISGGAFGIEGGIVTTAVLIIALAVVFFLPTSEKELSCSGFVLNV